MKEKARISRCTLARSSRQRTTIASDPSAFQVDALIFNDQIAAHVLDVKRDVSVFNNGIAAHIDQGKRAIEFAPDQVAAQRAKREIAVQIADLEVAADALALELLQAAHRTIAADAYKGKLRFAVAAQD